MRVSPAVVVALYGLSGAAGLAWQVLLVRAFTPVFGAGAEAIAAVTACFLGGLGVGGALAPRLVRRLGGLRAYGLLEVGAGLWGAALPWLVAASGPLVVATLRAAGEGAPATFVRLLLSAATVGPLAIALGATFPAVAAALRADDRPERVGLAYGVNAIGAAVGALAAGLWLPWALGLKLGALALGGLNVLVGVGALARGGSRGIVSPPGEEGRWPRGLLALAFVTGFVGMGFELCWTRVSGPLLAARTGSDAVAFSIVLAAVVLGIGIGGVVSRRAGDGLGRSLAIAQGALCLAVLAVLEPTRDLLLGAARQELVEGLLPVLPALLLGATFPLLSNALAAAGTSASRGLGRLYAVNTAGAVTGSLLTGFVLMPLVGAQRMLVLLAGTAGAVALFAWLRSGRRRAAVGWAAVAVPAVVAAFVITPPVAGARVLPPSEQVFETLEGRQGSTLVSGRGGDRALTSGGHRIGAANRMGRVNDHALRAQGPASLHRAPKRVLLVGMGTGATAEAFLALDTVESLTVVELDANMADLLPHFGTEHILDDPRLRLVLGDGRWFVRAAQAEWDVIAVDAYGPRTASATFYTADFYAEAKARLARGGLLFVKFNPAAFTEAAPLASYLGTLWSVFPDGALVFVQRGFMGLVGVEDRSWLQVTDRRIVADGASSAGLVAGARLHTDDRPVGVRDTAVPGFSLLQPYWEARGRADLPPWGAVRTPGGRGGPPDRSSPPPRPPGGGGPPRR